ncbi:MAG: phosphatidylserine decarboxylase [Burkholderiales bacterium]|nr:phosphatidylserine decarboxylase [Burkholderiales bacterium]
MANYPHPIIAREGWLFLAGSIVVSLIASYFFGWWSIPLWLISIFVLQFFRDPPRDIPQMENAVLAPADGRIVSVERAHDPYLNREALRLSVFMNVFNAHSNRSPVDGVVRETWYHPGSFVNASLAKASLDNERSAMWLKTKNGIDVTCVQVAGLVARRILSYAKVGDQLSRGQRYGFIRFGSRVDVYLPIGSKPKASVGDKVYATCTILAELPNNA